MFSEAVVEVHNLGKAYSIYDTPRDRLKAFIMPSLLRLVGQVPSTYGREFWALRNVSFTVSRGQAIGILGRNGVGKSTLLQLICGILSPTEGQVYTRGRIAALLELGSGFNPEFTGRENVYLNATLLGLTQEQIKARFQQIADFAEIDSFLDQPVKTYSSGMYVRLAFAVIAHVEADILIIDEALAVGDVFFQQKCMRFLKQFRANGGTIILVTHDTGTVMSMCETALLLPSERTVEARMGSADEISRRYLETYYSQVSASIASPSFDRGSPSLSSTGAIPHTTLIKSDSEHAIYSCSSFNTSASSFGNGKATIIDAGMYDSQGARLGQFTSGRQVKLIITVQTNERIEHPAFGFMIKTKLGEYLVAEGTDRAYNEVQMPLEPRCIVTVAFTFRMPHLIRGVYPVNVAIADGKGDAHTQLHWIHDAFVITCLDGRLVHGYCGVDGLNYEITINLNRDTADVK